VRRLLALLLLWSTHGLADPTVLRFSVAESWSMPLVRLENGTAFIALDSFERIEQEADPQLVEAEVPRTMLAALGLPVAPEQAGETVRAEMLVAADGEPLALRLSAIDD